MTWRTIESAPRDQVILLYGTLHGIAVTEFHTRQPIRVVGYWCSLDEAWSLSDTPYSGLFINPTHWAPCPEAPTEDAAEAAHRVVQQATEGEDQCE